MTPRNGPARILVAVDFGEASAAAVTLAGELAGVFDATLTVLHAETFEMPPYFTSAQVQALEDERLAARQAATAYVRAFAARHTARALEAHVEDGPAVEAILHAAGDFDLVVLGTHGRRGPGRWWLGSVAERVLHGSPVPVLVTCALDGAALHRMREGAAAVRVRPDAGDWTDAVADALGIPVQSAEPALVVSALRSCSFPVLYVPDTRLRAERSSS